MWQVSLDTETLGLKTILLVVGFKELPELRFSNVSGMHCNERDSSAAFHIPTPVTAAI